MKNLVSRFNLETRCYEIGYWVGRTFHIVCIQKAVA